MYCSKVIYAEIFKIFKNTEKKNQKINGSIEFINNSQSKIVLPLYLVSKDVTQGIKIE